MKRIVLLFYLTCWVVMARGLTFTVDKITYKTLTDNTVTVTGFTLSMKDVVIPSKVTYQDIEYDVKEISERGLYGYKSGTSSSMETLTIYEGIEKIGKEAVISNKKLKSVSLPSTLVEIGESSFYNLAALQSVEFPNGSNLLIIGNSAFESCEKLEDFEIPSSVKSIGQEAFRYCKKFITITIPQGVTVIQKYAFSDCRSLTTVVLHNQILRIEDGAFHYCYALENIDTSFPEILEYIGSYAFYGVPGIKHLILNGNLGTINISSFAECNNLEYVWLKEGITTISKWAFGTCRKLNYIVLPSTLETVESGAFGESNEKLLDYVDHNPRQFFFLSDEPFTIKYSSTTDGSNAFPSLGKIVEGDCFYVKESAVDRYKEKWKLYQSASNKVSYKIPFNTELVYSTNYREFDADYSVAANSGNMPFVAIKFGDSSALFKSIDNNIVPAETGIVIRRTSDDNTWYQIAENQGNTIEETNYLKGVTYSDVISPTTDNGEVNLVLKNGVFCRFDNAGYLGDHKAYLQLPYSTENSVKINFLDDNANDISEATFETQNEEDIYTLNGMRVKTPQKGVYIVNKKKIIIK